MKNNKKMILLIEIALLVILPALAYLPNLTKMTYYRDDWYYMVDGYSAGPAVFANMFSIDRPARGVLFGWYYSAFGINPLPYHIFTFVFRLVSGLAAWWLFRLLWPRHQRATFFMALLFTLYPGYLWWVAGVEYQPMILSVLLQVLSITMTLEALRANKIRWKTAWWAGSILTGWAYIALVDYAIGMEAFRFLCIFLFVTRGESMLPFAQKLLKALRAWAIAALVPVGFLVWRLFFFHNLRPDTDINLQVGEVLTSPLFTGLWWIIRWVQSTLNVSIFAWAEPFYQNVYRIRMSNIIFGMVLAAIAAGCIWLGDRQIRKFVLPEDSESTTEKWQLQAIWIGLMGVIAGVLPVVLANRYIVFERYSHYALPASLAGVVFITGLIFMLDSKKVQRIILSAFVAIAVMTHYSISTYVAQEENTIRDFWWQVSWRVPALNKGTTLMVNYPSITYGEDIDIVTGPALFIYFPNRTAQIPVEYEVSGFQIGNDSLTKILSQEKAVDSGYRSHVYTVDYQNILVMTQPTENACVHILDNQYSELSTQDTDQMLLVGNYSNIQNVQSDGNSPRPPALLFGSEPAHTWCYYYEKAELARQKADWSIVADLGKKAVQQGLHPNDAVEWMPFIEADAILGNAQNLKDIAPRMTWDHFLKAQACTTLTELQNKGIKFSSDVQNVIKDAFCQK